jgi:hypothetical protein
LSETNVSARNHAHWKAKDLLPFAVDGKWVNLDAIEYFWVEIIHDLRKVGMSIQSIYNVKDLLFQTYSKGHQKDYEAGQLEGNAKKVYDTFFYDWNELEGFFGGMLKADPFSPDRSRLKEFTLFELLVLSVLTEQTDYCFVIGHAGSVDFVTLDKELENKDQSFRTIHQAIEHLIYQPVVIISLRKYLYQMIANPNYQKKAGSLNILSSIELEVLKLIREGQVKELTIDFNKKSKKKYLIQKYTGAVDQKEWIELAQQFLQKKYDRLQCTNVDGQTIQYERIKRSKFED